MIDVQITTGPLTESSHACDGAGAVVTFRGVVRPTENDRPLLAIDYQTYEPMTQNTLTQLAERAVVGFGVLAMHIEHSRGRVDAGATSFQLVVAGKHRKETLAAMDWFIDRMKRDVPIWKLPIYAEHAAEVTP